MTTRRTLRRGACAAAAAVALASISLTPRATAAPGDYSYAHAQFLQGSLLGQLTVDQLADLAGEQAESDGTAADGPHQGNLDLTLLGAIPLEQPGGVQVPLDQTEVGALGQYAFAGADGASVAAVGAVTSDGAIGTGIESGEELGALSLSLDGLLTSLGAPEGVLADVAALDLRIDGVSARAAQAAPSAPTGSYSIGDVELVLQSPLIAQLVGILDTQVADGLASLLATLQGQANTVLALVSGNLPAGVANVSISVTGLQTVEDLLSNLTTLDGNGLHVDLTTGTITVDIDELVELNGRAPNTVVLTPEVLAGILTNVLGLVDGVVDNVNAALGQISVNIAVTVNNTPVNLPVSLGTLLGTSLGALLDPLLPDDVDALINQLTTELGVPLNLALGTSLTNLLDLLQVAINPVLGELGAVFDAVEQVARLTVNVQEPTPPTAVQRFTERALRVELLPAQGGGQLDLANATVGPNVQAVPPNPPCVITLSSIVPASGPSLGGTLVTITGTGLSGATGVSFGGTPALEFGVIDDTTLEAVTPAHSPGDVDVTVTGAGCATGTIGFEYLGGDDTPEGIVSSSTTLPPAPPADPTPVTLPATGSESAGGTAAIAALLLAAGVGLVVATRRRRASAV